MPLNTLYSTEKYITHYSTSKDSDDGTIAKETVNTVHCLRLNCKTTQHFSRRICLRPQGESGEPTVDGTVRNNRSHPWSWPTKVGSPVYPFHLKTVKVKQSHYRPEQAMRVPGGWGSQISRQSTHEGGKVNPTHRPPLPQGHSATGRMSIKIPMTPSGIEPATFRLVA